MPKKAAEKTAANGAAPESKLDVAVYEMAAREALWPLLPVVMANVGNGQIVYASAPAAAVFGYLPAELVGLSVESLIPERLRATHAHYRADATIPNVRAFGVARCLTGLRKNGTEVALHIGLVEIAPLGEPVAVAFVIDLSPLSPAPLPVALVKGVIMPTKNPPAPTPPDENAEVDACVAELETVKGALAAPTTAATPGTAAQAPAGMGPAEWLSLVEKVLDLLKRLRNR